ncbi:MAG: bifunctional ADP-dependent NAD(P)H-hydrate dehydratase/NAD(P)H-hydrate epimerase [Alphaproteobacteria bacterium]|nr:MAG: bifunctional ADP-dependent NAD(P)H-hydrate dehydratase/NAD(P)H-hydrate epimerase [Alphaproteobacteria bacterium]
MTPRGRNALLTVEEMARADQLAIRSGILGADLMEAAGLAVTRHIMHRYDQGKTLVLCGPGNNGGDGFVIARHLKEAGWDVELALLGARENLSGDAAIMAAKWQGAILPLKARDIKVGDHGLVVDAIFGAGLCRPIEGPLVGLIDEINSLDGRVVAVDVPSGVDGNSGQIRGAAFRADSTVTFFRKKPGHLLYPGKEYCGDLVVVDIGIAERILKDIDPKIHRNDPEIWLDRFPVAIADGHKYSRGYAAVISGGAASGGAARLAAGAALRIGAGLVSITCPHEAVPAHAAQLTAVMIKPFAGDGDIDGLLADGRLNYWCVGPGCGVTGQTKSHVLKILAADRHCVIDADGLTVFSQKPDVLFKAIKKSDHMPVLTPHGGEFSRLFPDLMGYDKLASARQAAVRAGAVIIYKGPDTVITSPDGRVVINDTAPPTLATAGSGDVLAGVCLGLMAQGMPAFEAACAAVWIHGAAATAFGYGLISEDIEGQIPEVLRYISERHFFCGNL